MATATHPLDPLTPDEIRTAIETAKKDARLAGAAFPSITLDEPAKAEVHDVATRARRSLGVHGCKR